MGSGGCRGGCPGLPGAGASRVETSRALGPLQPASGTATAEVPEAPAARRALQGPADEPRAAPGEPAWGFLCWLPSSAHLHLHPAPHPGPLLQDGSGGRCSPGRPPSFGEQTIQWGDLEGFLEEEAGVLGQFMWWDGGRQGHGCACVCPGGTEHGWAWKGSCSHALWTWGAREEPGLGRGPRVQQPRGGRLREVPGAAAQHPLRGGSPRRALPGTGPPGGPSGAPLPRGRWARHLRAPGAGSAATPAP